MRGGLSRGVGEGRMEVPPECASHGVECCGLSELELAEVRRWRRRLVAGGLLLLVAVAVAGGVL